MSDIYSPYTAILAKLKSPEREPTFLEHMQNVSEQSRKREKDEREAKAADFAQMLKEQYGGREAEANLGLKEAQIKALEEGRNMSGGTRRGTAGTAGSKQYAPSHLAKLFQEAQEIEDGFLPGSNGTVELTPDQQEMYREQNALERQKKTSDSKTRDRSLLASNLEKSMNSIDSDDITRYSGPAGAANLAMEQARDLAGSPSKDYLKYKEALVASEFETSELRQFFGDSITPEVRKHLQILSNPSSLGLSPKAAKAQIEKSRSIVKKQLETFRRALKTTKAYEREEPSIEQQAQDAFGGVNSLSDEELQAMYGEI